VTPAEGLRKCGENRTEEGSMSEGNEIGRRSAADGSIGVGSGSGREWAAYVNFPEFGGWCSGTLENDTVLVTDGDIGGGEGNVTAGVAELSDAEEWLGSKVGNYMSMAGG